MPRADFVVSAGGIVLRDQDVLLIRVSDVKGRAVWTFPKGRLNDGETSPNAAVREVEEETGWRCRIDGELASSDYWFQREGRRIRKTVRWFRMRPIQEIRVPDGEVDEVLWLTVSDAMERLTYPSDRGLLQSALSQRSTGVA
ncbi:MAG: NUDIX hydrolase [Nitrospiraceae bacterium]|jgi:ADP-ribose pyrophosphatase YjhB (NUDIX family)